LTEIAAIEPNRRQEAQTYMDFDFARMIQRIAVLAPGFLLAITVHEFMHGYIAYRFGDPTAKLQGRLTFNPISHLDPIGSLLLILAGIGWAKPVPVDPRNLRNPRRDMLWISLAGPAANMVAAVMLAVVIHVLAPLMGMSAGRDLSSLALGPSLMLVFAVHINVMLAVFNMIPVPPLDGAGILAGLLPTRLAYQFESLAPYGPILLLVLLLLPVGVLEYIIWPPILFIDQLLLPGGLPFYVR
jgi:Zn-dependent protease